MRSPGARTRSISPAVEPRAEILTTGSRPSESSERRSGADRVSTGEREGRGKGSAKGGFGVHFTGRSADQSRGVHVDVVSFRKRAPSATLRRTRAAEKREDEDGTQTADVLDRLPRDCPCRDGHTSICAPCPSCRELVLQ